MNANKERNLRSMKECLERINKKYEPGCVEWATGFTGNAWDEAFENIEKHIEGATEMFFKRQLNYFETTITGYIERYKNIKKQQEMTL